MPDYQYYLAVSGLAGGTSSAQHYGFEVSGFSFSDALSVSTGGGGAGVGKPQIGDLNVSISSEQGLTDFLAALDDGRAFKDATLYGQEASGDGKATDVYELTLGNFFVAGVHEDNNGGYTVTLTPESFGISTRAFDTKGAVGSWSSYQYDVATGKGSTSMPQAATGTATSTDVAPVAHYYVSFDGITGDTTAKDHKGAFDLASFALDAGNAVSIGSGGGASKAGFSALRIELQGGDDSLARLFQQLATGRAINGVDIYGDDANGNTIYHLSLDTAVVSSLADGTGQGHLALSLGYQGFSLSTTGENGKGGLGTPDTFSDAKLTNGFDPHVSPISVSHPGFDYYLAVSGMAGGTSSAAHYGFEVTSFAFADSSSINLGQGGGSGSGKPQIGELTVSIATEQGLADFLSALDSGKALSDATLYGQQQSSGDGKAVDLYELTLNDFHVTSVQENASRGYVVTLAPESFGVATRAIDGKGAVGSWSSYQYDVATGKGSTSMPQAATGTATSTDVAPVAHYYVSFDGITGDTTAKDHKGAFDLADFSFDASSDVSSGGGGSGVGKADFSSLLLDLQGGDGALSRLFQQLTTGREINGVDIYGDDANGNTIYHLSLDTAAVSSLSDGSGQGRVEIGVAYQGFSLSTTGEDSKGGLGTPDTFSDAKLASSGQQVATPQFGDGSTQYYLAVSGLAGGTSAAQHYGFDITSFSFSDTLPVSLGQGGGSGAGKPHIGDLTVSIATEQGLTDFLSALNGGKAFSGATLYGQEASGDGKAVDIYKLDLADFFVTSVSEDSLNGYSVTLSPSLFAISTREIDSKGAVGNWSGYGYDVATGKGSTSVPAATTGLRSPMSQADQVVHYYVSFDGITGDTTAKDHKGAFDLTAFSFGASTDISIGAGSGSAGKPNYSPLGLFLDDGDGSLARLFQQLTTGRAINGVDIYGDDASGQTVYHLSLDTAFITSLADSNGAGGVLLSLSYDTLSLETPGAATNHSPALTGAQATLAAGVEDTAYTVTKAALLTGFTDADGDTLSVAGLTADHGTVADDGSGGFIVTPDANYNGPVVLSYTVSDGQGGTIAATLGYAVTPVNDAPALTGAQATLAAGTEDTAYAVTKAALLTGFTDVDGDTLSITGLTADHGTVADDGSGGFIVTPDANYNGPVVLSYTVSDGQGGTIAASLGYAVTPVNDAPALTGAQATLASGTEDTAYTVTKAALLTGFTDVDGDSLSVVGLTADHGTVADDGAGGFTITPDADYNGPMALSYTVSDGQGGTVAASLGYTVTPVDDTHIVHVTAGGSYDGSGEDSIFTGTPDDFQGDSFSNIQPGDSIVVEGTGFIPGSAVSLTLHSLDFHIDTDGDGFKDLFFTFADPVENMSLHVTTTDAGTEITPTLLAPATDGADTITGTHNPDYITGKGGDDILQGLGGNDALSGGAGDDIIQGGAGNDWIDGGTGNDVLSGGGGSDIFVFDNAGPNTGSDRILDFGQDDLILTTAAIYDSNKNGIITFGSNKLLDFDNGGQVAMIDGSGKTIRSIDYVGTVDDHGTTYYVYSAINSTLGVDYLRSFDTVTGAHAP